MTVWETHFGESMELAKDKRRNEWKASRAKYVVQSKSNAYIFIVTVQELLLQPR